MAAITPEMVLKEMRDSSPHLTFDCICEVTMFDSEEEYQDFIKKVCAKRTLL